MWSAYRLLILSALCYKRAPQGENFIVEKVKLRGVFQIEFLLVSHAYITSDWLLFIRRSLRFLKHLEITYDFTLVIIWHWLSRCHSHPITAILVHQMLNVYRIIFRGSLLSSHSCLNFPLCLFHRLEVSFSVLRHGRTSLCFR